MSPKSRSPCRLEKKMPLPTQRNRVLQKRIPTIVGLLILVGSLAVGAFFFKDGLGVFAPRATPETTPKQTRITNITDSGFTVSFITDEMTPAYVKYGSSANELDSQSSDDRDQLSGTINGYNTHHITVRGLDQDTTYYYTLGTGSGVSFDNNGEPFSVTTAKKSGVPSAAKTIYGTILNESSAPAEDVIVYVTLEGAGDMSSLVRKSGSWAVPLSNARTKDKSGYAALTDEDQVSIRAQGKNANSTAQAVVLISGAQPVATMTLGQGSTAAVADTSETTQTQPAQPANESTQTNQPPQTSPPSQTPEPPQDPIKPVEESKSNNPGALGGLLDKKVESQSLNPQVVNVNGPNDQVIETSKPVISGTAAPNITIKIEVHSDTQIVQQIVTNADGTYSLDLKSLGQDLEPGEHTVTVSYTDPNTNKLVTETITFTVSSANTQLAQANTGTNVPFGTGNPFPGGSSSPYPSASASASPTASASASPNATGSASPSPATGSGSKGGVQPATGSTLPESGSVGTTMALVFGGLFFIISGVWSFWIAHELRDEEAVFEE